MENANLKTPNIGFVTEVLESARQRKKMYLRNITVLDAENFLAGFDVACFALGTPVPAKLRQQATEQRGWRFNALGSVTQMRERGLSEEMIVDELFAIEILSWKLWDTMAE